MSDRYTKLVLAVIAAALIYLCVVLTPVPAVHAQRQNTLRPGEPTGPVEAVIVGWRGAPGETIPVSTALPVPVVVKDTVQISGKVATERSSGAADRVVLVGWEEGAVREKQTKPMRAITPATPVTPGLPVSVK